MTSCTFSDTTASQDIKAATKLVGKALKSKGHAVPHSVLLHAMSSALGETSWHSLKQKLTGHAAAPVDLVSAAPLWPSDSRTVRRARLARFLGAQVTFDSGADKARCWGYDGLTVPSTRYASALEAAEAALAAMATSAEGGMRYDGLLSSNKFVLPATLNLATSLVEDCGLAFPVSSHGTFVLRNSQGHTLDLWCIAREDGQWGLLETGVNHLDVQLYGLVKEPFTLHTPALVPCGPSVGARFFTDDHVFDFTFDAAAWMQQASDTALAAVFNCGFGGDYPTDDIGTGMADHSADEEFKDAFAYLAAVQKRQSLGFEVKTDGEEFCQWLKIHRPAVLALCLCEYYDISLVEAQEDEVRGMWDWIDRDSGNACDCSWPTEAAAAQDAVLQLDLLTRFGEEGLFAAA